MILLIPVIMCLVGLVVYILSANPKAAELGRITFSCGLLVTLLHIGGTALKLL